MASEETVWVKRHPNDWRVARYKVSDISDVHWSHFSGGVQAPFPRPMLCGYVWCDDMLEGELAHSCQHGEGPHRIKVCITKRGNDPKVYQELAEAAGTKPPVGPPKCKTMARRIVKEMGVISEAELLDRLEAAGYDKRSAFRTIRRLGAYGRKLVKKEIDGKIFYIMPQSS